MDREVSVEINNKSSAARVGVYFNNHIILPHEIFKRRKLIRRLINPKSCKKSSIESSESEENFNNHSVLGGEGQVFNTFNSFIPKYQQR